MEKSSDVINLSRFNLTPAHNQAMSLRFQGHTYSHIASVIKYHVGTIRNWFAQDGILAESYRKYCEDLMTPGKNVIQSHSDAMNVADRIKSFAPTAIDAIGSLITGAIKEETKLAAAKDVLDRAGYMPVQKLVALHAIDEMNINQLDAFVGNILNVPTPIYKEAVIDSTSIDVPDLTHLDDKSTTYVPDSDSCRTVDA